jgi:hypothetical protein
MKKKIMSIAFVAAIAVAAAWNFSRNSNAEVELSDIALDNIEALAGGEAGTPEQLWCGHYCTTYYGYTCYILRPSSYITCPDMKKS